jgi:hypothetical protein
MVEAAIATLVVSIMLVAALNTIGAARTGERKMGDRARGMLLAQALMAEILQQDYEEPVDTPLFGREASEGAGNRAAYDDVDDYHGWKSAPPEYRDGTQIPNLTEWERTVTVVWADLNDLTQTSASATGVKRITVTVSRSGLPTAELVAIRTGALKLFKIEQGAIAP